MRLRAGLLAFLVAVSGNAFSSPTDASPMESTQKWTLTPDKPIHTQLKAWAKTSGWTFNWALEKSWLVAAPAQFTGTFEESLTNAIGTLYSEGKPVRLSIWSENQFAEVTYATVQ